MPLIIERKRDGGELSASEIRALVGQFTAGELPDYQMSALAMAIFFRGCSRAETLVWTAAMRDSGLVFRYPDGTPPKVDKHSTGGVGDKVSLVLAPLLASAGSWVPMVSGRGLGITGGTLDKLESIPGFDVHLDEARAMRQLQKIGVFMGGQTAQFCPADRKLYALRDVSGTVPSIPLIVASIMSKKLAESLDRLVLDVKFGTGALMKSRAEAEVLASELVAAGIGNGVQTTAVMTAMNEPLGMSVGNALEVAEAIETLQGRGPQDLRTLTLDLAAKVASVSRDELEKKLDSGEAWNKWVELVEAQGGQLQAMERIAKVHSAPVIHPIEADRSGKLVRMDAGTIGRAVVLLGAGRRVATDGVDFAVGVSGLKKVGAKVVQGEPLLLVHARDDFHCEAAVHAIRTGISIE